MIIEKINSDFMNMAKQKIADWKLNRVEIINYKKGDVIIAEFRQILNVAPNKYTLSFSCTHINAKGELEVLNRKYEALLIEVISSKDSVGLLRIDPEIEIIKE